MEQAMQSISNDETIRSDTGHDLKEFNNQSSATQAKKENNQFQCCLLLTRLLI